jgi:predicted nuclease of predicted toxin-antitoxin system
MKLLFDQNLPRSLVNRFEEAFPGSKHVVTLGLSTATDATLYEYARDQEYAIVSKDSDFRQLSFVLGAPPKVIWLRVGNSSVKELVEVFGKNVSRILDFEREPESFLVIDGSSTQGAP